MVFDGQLGTITGYQASLQVKEGAQPRFIRARPVKACTFCMAAVEQELERLEKEGILEKVSSSEWATPIVIVPKRGGGLRLCGDYNLTINPVLETRGVARGWPQVAQATPQKAEKFCHIHSLH